MPPQFFWLWAPVHFDEVCTHFDVNEDSAGRRWHAAGCIAGVGETGPLEAVPAVEHRIRWQPGTRRVAAAEIVLTPHRSEPWVITLEPILTFQMRGLGDLDPEWGHGVWKGPAALAGDTWRLAELDPMDPRHLHVQQLCRARSGSRVGIGVLEQMVICPHAPSGFSSLLDRPGPVMRCAASCIRKRVDLGNEFVAAESIMGIARAAEEAAATRSP